MNNCFLIGTGEVLGYCSIIPKAGEEHMFGDRVVKFVYAIGDLLFFADEANALMK
jgi:hypothetical protein